MAQIQINEITVENSEDSFLSPIELKVDFVVRQTLQKGKRQRIPSLSPGSNTFRP